MGYKVSVRQKKINGGRKSLYLDYYPAIPSKKKGNNKTTRREFLGSYIFEKPKNQLERNENEQKLRIAEAIRVNRENNLNKPEIYSQDEREKLRLKEMGEQSFIDYFEKLMNKRTGSNYGNWSSAYNYLKIFAKGSLQFSEIDVVFLEQFKEFLLTTASVRSDKMKLSQNSAASYFNKVKATLRQAFSEGLLQVDINGRVKSIKAQETVRDFLLEEELNLLIKTPCENKDIKTISLFSSLTSLAFKEIKNMVWGDISFDKKDGYTILTKRQKTQKYNYLPVPEQAISLLGERMGDDQEVFPNLKYSAHLNRQLSNWIEKAGISKKITFHCFRHTYAIIQIKNGTDIFVLSKMMGHKNIGTTLIYAKVVDELKRQTTNKINLNFEENEG